MAKNTSYSFAEQLRAQRPQPTYTSAIIGDGLSSLAVLTHLVLNDPAPGHVVIIGDAGIEKWGRGAAYSTERSEHILNVPAEKMGFLEKEDSRIPHSGPNGFLTWILTHETTLKKEHVEWESLDFSKNAYLPRGLYGLYIDAIKTSVLEYARTHQWHLDFVHGHSTEASYNNAHGYWNIPLQSAQKSLNLQAHSVVLATGNSAPQRLDATTSVSPSIVDNPWAVNEALTALKPVIEKASSHSHIVIQGAGPTAVDWVLTLEKGGYFTRGGKVTVVSHDTQWPYTHSKVQHFYPEGRLFETLPRTAKEFQVRIKAAIADLEAPYQWQDVLSTARNVLPKIWQQWAPEEQQRFLKGEIAHWWKPLRNRVPATSKDVIDRLTVSGGLRLLQGSITSLHTTASDSSKKEINVRLSNGSLHDADAVINASGPNRDLTRFPLYHHLLQTQQIAVSPVGVGLEASSEGRATIQGKPTAGPLYVVGNNPQHYSPGGWQEGRKEAATVTKALSAELQLKASQFWQNTVLIRASSLGSHAKL